MGKCLDTLKAELAAIAPHAHQDGIVAALEQAERAGITKKAKLDALDATITAELGKLSSLEQRILAEARQELGTLSGEKAGKHSGEPSETADTPKNPTWTTPEYSIKLDQKLRKARRDIEAAAFSALTQDPTAPADPDTVLADLKAYLAGEQARAPDSPEHEKLLKLMLDGDKVTIPPEFIDSVAKERAKLNKANEKARHQDPQVYRDALAAAFAQVDIGHNMTNLTDFEAGFKHHLAGHPISTLPPGDKDMIDGYKAAEKWTKTEVGKAWYSGKPQKKLENTGAVLRRWWDKAKADLDNASKDDADLAFRQIDNATQRAEFFRDVAGEGATPGTLRYIDAIREAVIPFKKWVVRELNIKWYRSEADAELLLKYLKGTGKPSPKDDHDISLAKRIERVRDYANQYTEAMRLIVSAVEGEASMVKAVTKFTGELWKPEGMRRYLEVLADGGIFYPKEEELTAFHEQIKDYFDKGWITLRNLSLRGQEYELRNENNAGKARKISARNPPLESVYREGKDWRGGLSVTPAQFKERFGFADFNFGESVTAQEGQNHLNYAYDSLMDLSTVMGVDPKAMGFGGQLYFTIGALGHGKFAAHFSPNHRSSEGADPVKVINLTKTRGDGTVAHEWFHALDDISPELDAAIAEIKRDLKKSYDVQHLYDAVAGFIKGSQRMTRTPKDDRQAQAYAGLDYYLRYPRHSDFFREATLLDGDNKSKPYWSNDKEPFARAAEAAVMDLLDDLKQTNNYLVNPEWAGENKITAPVYTGKPYPAGEERTRFKAYYKALFDAMTFKDGVFVFDREKFNTEKPQNQAEFDRAVAELRANIPDMVQQYQDAKAGAAKLKEMEAAEQARLEREAEKARIEAELAQNQSQSEATPPGVLSESDLERLFDEAADRIGGSDNPEVAPLVDENPKPKALSDADKAYLLGQVREGRVILMASKDFGLPTIHDYSAKAQHLGFGVFKVTTPDYEATMDGGGAMLKTPGGESYTTVQFKKGKEAFPWDRAAVEKALATQPKPEKAQPSVRDEINPLYQALTTGDKRVDYKGNHYSLMQYPRSRQKGGVTWAVKQGSATYLPGDRDVWNPELAAIKAIDEMGFAYEDYKYLFDLGEAADTSAPATDKTDKTDKTEPKTGKMALAMAKEAAELGVKGIDEALQGLVELFGGNSLKSFPAGFDENAYAKAKPHFEAALAAFQAAGKTIVDLFEFLIRNFGLGIRPYAIRFAQDHKLNTNLQAQEQLTGSQKTARFVAAELEADRKITWQQLFAKTDEAFGGTMANNDYTVKDAYDALEAGVNQFILANPEDFSPAGKDAKAAAKAISFLNAVLALVPTQTKRTAEMEEFQQFSTPPTLAFAANWVANVHAGESMLEPSAGIGGLATFATLAGAEVTVNELSQRRAGVLREVLPGARLFTENAEHLANILPQDIRPSVIVMNPPFSSTAGRIQGQRDSRNGAKHIEEALKRLAPGGRLVAIVGNSMAMDRPAFKAWWTDMKAKYHVRANISVNGEEYAKYGTTFDNQLLVIDKVAPPDKYDALTGKVDKIAELIPLLQDIRDERQTPDINRSPVTPETQPPSGQPGRQDLPGPAGNRQGAGNAADSAADADRSGQPTADGQGNRTGLQGQGRNDQTGERPGQPGQKRDGKGGAQDNRGDTGQPGRPGETDGPGRGGRAAGGRDDEPGPLVEAGERSAHGDLTDSLYADYQPAFLRIEGAQPHPGSLVESAAMASVDPPKPTYSPNLPKETVTKGKLSLAQLESVVYAGQAFAKRLRDGARKGFMIGDGTGVGKGREIAGVILDAIRSGHGNGKAVWVSSNAGLFNDSKGYYSEVGGTGAFHNQPGGFEPIKLKDGVLFVSYAWLAGKDKKAGADGNKASHVDLLLDWLGPDFDGVIAFDEAHKMSNASAEQGARGKSNASQTAIAGITLQDKLKDARILYASATAATEVRNLLYATRLGLWGTGTAFSDKSKFLAEIAGAGTAAMEFVAQGMKAAGAYIARSLSFDGVEHETLEHELTDDQRDIYDNLAQTWQQILTEFRQQAVANGEKRFQGESAFWGAQQRFFNAVITSMSLPTVIQQAKEDIARGDAVVFQLTNTGEAQQDREVLRASAENLALEEMDFSPKQTLITMVNDYYPVNLYEDVETDSGITQQLVLDSEGNPVVNQEAVAARDALIGNIEGITFIENPLDMLINAFGHENMAEVTGRSNRYVWEPDKDGELRMVKQALSDKTRERDIDKFMDDKVQVLVFSEAGGTGYSYHADNTRLNKRRRRHYLVQAGWQANKAVQGLGRSHRTNEASQPKYTLPTTNLKAQKRFISSIARRLDQLGALTRGQRQTGGQGIFKAEDNLENAYAQGGVDLFLSDLFDGAVPGLSFDDIVVNKMGFNNLIDNETYPPRLKQKNLPVTTRFLNRMLSLTMADQDRVFDEVFDRISELVARDVAAGTYDEGIKTLRAQKITKDSEEEIFVDSETGAKADYVQLSLTQATQFNDFEDTQAMASLPNWRGYFRDEKSGRVFGMYKTGTKTQASGHVTDRGAVVPVSYSTGGSRIYRDDIGKFGTQMFNKKVMVPHFKGNLHEMYDVPALNRQGTVRSSMVNDYLAQGGDARVKELIRETKVREPERGAAIEKLYKAMLASPEMGEAENTEYTKQFTELSEAEAAAAWEAEAGQTPKTYQETVHLIKGVLLPIWDRIPGQPVGIRVQTADGETMLGREIPRKYVKELRQNFNMGSPVAQLSTREKWDLINKGNDAKLANGWRVKAVRVSNDKRVELVMAMATAGDTRMVEGLGVFGEKIAGSWNTRYFIPNLSVFEKLAEIKPVVEIEGLDTQAQGVAEEAETAFSKNTRAGGALSSGSGQGLSVARAKALLTPKQAELAASGKLDIVASDDSGTEGFYNADTDTITLVAGNLDKGSLHGVLQHELLHRALNVDAKVKAAFGRLQNTLQGRFKLAAKGMASRAENAAYQRVLAAETPKARQLEEFAAYLISGYRQQPKTLGAALAKAVRDVVGAIRAVLLRAGYTFRTVQAADLDALAQYGLKIVGGKNYSPSGKFTARLQSAKAQRFYSALKRAFIAAPDKVFGNGKQVAAWLQGNAAKMGVKADEVYWSGLNDYLNLQPKATREDVLAYLDGNGVQVEEVVLGVGKEASAYYKLVDEAIKNGDMAAADRYRDQAIAAEEGLPTKYAQYTVPGGIGGTYRETLLTLPVKRKQFSDRKLTFTDYVEDYYGNRPSELSDRMLHAAEQNYKQYELEYAREAAQDFSQPYKSSHWDSPNVIAHTRSDERTDSDGGKVLFVHEIQSDWGQEGKKKGFTKRQAKASDYPITKDRALWILTLPDGGTIPFNTQREAERQREIYLADKPEFGITPAPFVTDTKAWVALAVKHIISDAVDRGINKVAFINGEQAADLYDLSKHISRVNVVKDFDGKTYTIGAFDKSGREVLQRQDVDEDKLPDYVGKELAEKIVEMKSGEGKIFSGLDLKVGGEGMRGFYDQIVPQVVRDIAKRMGGRVEEIEVLTSEPYDPQPGTTNYVDENGRLEQVWHDQGEFYGKDRYGDYKGWMTQLSLEITPAMKAKILAEGMPLFSRKPSNSPDTGNILYSRAMPGGIRDDSAAPGWAAPLADTATQAIMDRFTTAKTFNWFNKAVNTQAYKAYKDRDYKRVFDESVAFEKTTAKLANTAADLAPHLLPKLEGVRESLKEVARSKQRSKDAEKVGKAIFDTTINDRPMTEQDLVDAGYSPAQRQMYHEFFAAVNKSLDDLALSEMARLAKQQGLALFSGFDLQAAAQFYADQAEDDPSLAQEYLDKAEKIQELKDKGYAPLQRFGQYTVTVQEEGGGRPAYFGLYESEAEANRDLRAFKEAYPDATVTAGVLSQDDWQMFRGVTPETIGVFAELMGVSQDKAFQEYLKQATSNRSALKRLIHRRKVEGYSLDPQRVLATFITSNARQASKNWHLGDMLRAVADIPKKKGDVKDEAVQLYNYVQNPGAEGAGVRNLLFAWYLGGSVAAAAVNLTQTFTTTYPALHKLGGAGEVGRSLLKAMTLAAKPSAITGNLKRALEEAEDEGITAPHELHMLYGESMRAGIAGVVKPLRPLAKLWGSFFAMAEGYNRRVAFIAAYNMARGPHQERFRQAAQMVDDTQFIYSKSNRSGAARSTAGSLVFTFKTFSISYMEFLAKLPVKERFIALGVLMLFAGAGGAPGADDLDDLIDTVGQSLGYNVSAKGWKERHINAFLLYGLSSVLPVDISARLGVGNLIPGSALFKRSETDKGRDVLEFVGPAGNLARNIVEGFDAAAGRKGIVPKLSAFKHAALPLALANLDKAIDMADTGMYKDYRGKKVVATTLGDAIAKGVGFQPNVVARKRRPERVFQQLKDFTVVTEAEIADLWAEGLFEKDPGKVTEAKGLLRDWNRRNQDTPIRVRLPQVLRRVKAMRQTSGERLMKMAPKEIRRLGRDMMDYK